MKYELVAGLETHVELSTKSKIFCSCTTEFGGEPNTHCCPICIGLPGTMPRLNERAVEFALLAGLATDCKINEVSRMDRKNYFYPDLPKAYQTSQYDLPLCYGGHIDLSTGRRIGITRIHLEEDAGKLINGTDGIYIDYNRGGVPLIEIVSEPDIRSIDEAREYLETLASIMRFIGVSDCKMQEGSLRCDVNISVRPEGQKEYGTRTEIKNMNSFTQMVKAMKFEYDRQVEVLSSGGKVTQETRRWDEDAQETFSMRSKEDAQDYRYFREPDLLKIVTTPERIEELRALLPEPAESKRRRYVDDMGLSLADADALTKYRAVAEYFEEAAEGLKKPKTVANIIIGQVFAALNTESAKQAAEILMSAEHLKGAVALYEQGKINSSVLKRAVDDMLLDGRPLDAAIGEGDMQNMDENELISFAKQAIESLPAAAADFKAGKDKAIKSIIGAVMKASQGKADPKAAERAIRELLQ